MIPFLLGLMSFAAVLGGWRWGLRSRNWLEGGLFALVVAIAVALAAATIQRALEQPSSPWRRFHPVPIRGTEGARVWPPTRWGNFAATYREIRFRIEPKRPDPSRLLSTRRSTMPRLVTGLFYTRQEAEDALNALRNAGLPAADLYLEQEVDPGVELGRKGGEITRLEQERRFAGFESGSIIGLAVGLIAGFGVGTLGLTVLEAARQSGDPVLVNMVPSVVSSPLWAAIVGGLIGAVVGALIGRIIDYTLDRMGAGPARPMEETLVTVRATEESLDEVYGTLFKARARHLHVSEMAA